MRFLSHPRKKSAERKRGKGKSLRTLIRRLGKKELGKKQPTKKWLGKASPSLSFSPSPLLVSSPHNLFFSN